MFQEVAGTWRRSEHVVTYRASYQVNPAERSIVIDGSAEVRGETLPIFIWVFWAGPDIERCASRIAELSIFSCLERMSVSP